jgi:hypothetical protein
MLIGSILRYVFRVGTLGKNQGQNIGSVKRVNYGLYLGSG